MIEQGFGSDAIDTVLVDLSTLRSSDTSEASSGIVCCSITCSSNPRGQVVRADICMTSCLLVHAAANTAVLYDMETAGRDSDQVNS